VDTRIYAAALWALSYAAFAMYSARRAATAAAVFAALGVLLLFGSDLFYVKDVFSEGSPRLNTIFKLSYQAWMLLALGGGAATVAALAEVKQRPGVAALVAPALLLSALGLAYPLLSPFNRQKRFADTTDGPPSSGRSRRDSTGRVVCEHAARRRDHRRRPTALVAWGHRTDRDRRLGLFRFWPHFRPHGPGDTDRLVFPRDPMAREHS
jgi:hypothetical protein